MHCLISSANFCINIIENFAFFLFSFCFQHVPNEIVLNVPRLLNRYPPDGISDAVMLPCIAFFSKPGVCRCNLWVAFRNFSANRAGFCLIAR